MIWDQLTTEQIGRIPKNIPVILTMAATEQHGKHLPLATDRLIGEHFVNELHIAIPDKVLVLPTVSIGCSSHHMDFSGTLTISHDTFVRQVEDIVKSVIQHGFTNIILLNSHGGNQAVGQLLVEKLGYENPTINIVMVTWWKLASEALFSLNESGKGGVGHACEFETSLMLLIAPHLVHLDKIEKGMHTKTFSWSEGDMLRGPKASYYRSTKEMTTNGVFGDPEYGTLEKGKQISKLVIDDLKNIINDLLTTE
ncbi:creatininase family protein [Snuella sedimenti]|uniref:Creatininase family protein n=1 Tax=Snuella sedimenti TaxID=2798802 RepID=A0A8J7J4P8_9FLAO|nr:creatininase family protein [Snuella sedimenti]MBJ6368609.1 creatininase family protein [Snuella sedimenti]